MKDCNTIKLLKNTIHTDPVPVVFGQLDDHTMRYAAQQKIGNNTFDIINFTNIVAGFSSERKLMINGCRKNIKLEDDCQASIFFSTDNNLKTNRRAKDTLNDPTKDDKETDSHDYSLLDIYNPGLKTIEVKHIHLMHEKKMC